jgi:hypothetical protein
VETDLFQASFPFKDLVAEGLYSLSQLVSLALQSKDENL